MLLVTSCFVCFLMNAAFQDAAFKRWQRLSEGGAFYKWLAEGAEFDRGRCLSEGGVH